MKFSFWILNDKCIFDVRTHGSTFWAAGANVLLLVLLIWWNDTNIYIKFLCVVSIRKKPRAVGFILFYFNFLIFFNFFFGAPRRGLGLIVGITSIVKFTTQAFWIVHVGTNSFLYFICIYYSKSLMIFNKDFYLYFVL